MKRVIKFRVWDKKNDRWFHGATDSKSRSIGTDAISLFGETIAFGEVLRDQNTDKMIDLERIKDLVPLQFTGLLDKNGAEIYEGDIVCGEYVGYQLDGTRTGKVIFDQGGFQFTDDAEHRFYFPVFELKNHEVIGNIYENKDLL